MRARVDRLFAWRGLVAGGLMLLAVLARAATAAAPAPDDELVAIGRAIYLEGRLPSGAALVGTRMGTKVRGQAAACVNCHRRSGMGSVEGDYLVSPITGHALFGTGGRVVATMDPVRGKLMNQAHEPYTDTTFAQAVRDGMHVSGRPMAEMMPRFELGERELRGVSAYLRTLSSTWSPGVDEDVLHLATIITPDVDARRKQAFLDTLRAAVLQKNGNTMPGKRHMVMAAEFALNTERKWDLQVWELQGDPSTWGAQLEEKYKAMPVFAVLSGLSNSTWAPVHAFCEQQGVPCWFPSVDAVPEQAKDGQYALYFSRGVALEAAVFAAHVQTLPRAQRPQRVIQVLRDEDPAHSGADALAQALAPLGIRVERRVVRAADDLRAALKGGGARDAFFFWLRPDDLRALDGIAPPSAELFFSSEMGEGEGAPLPAAWRSAARLIYPYELPQKRGANLAYFRAWLNQRRIAVVDERMQNEVFFAVNYFSDTVSEMLDNLYRDYLIERGENELSRREGRRAEESTRDRQQLRGIAVRSIEAGNTGGSPGYSMRAPGRAVITAEENLGKRTGTSVYPSLSLAPGQRFASKGAYIVRFAHAEGADLATESDWIVP